MAFPGRALALFVCLPLVGCVFGPGRTGPEGLSGYDTDLRSIARQEDFERALELTDEGNGDDAGDDLLRELHRAALLHYDGQYESSNELLQEAEREIEDRHTKSVSRAALSVLTNDRVLAYNPPSFERIMLHYYGALNYLALGELDEAAVEARRMSARLVRDEEAEEDARHDRFRRTMHYVAGTVFEAAGEWNAAEVAYRNAWEGWDLTPGRPESELGTGPGVAPGPARDSSLSRGLAALTPSLIARDGSPPADSGEVVLLLETGFVAHRIERALAVPIFEGDVNGLNTGEDDSRYNQGLCIAARAMGARASIDPSDCSNPVGKSLFVVTVAWPEMRRSGESVRAARLRAYPRSTDEPVDSRLVASGAPPGSLVLPDSPVGWADPEDSLTVPTRLTIDLSSVATSEFDARIGGIVAKAIVRATTKYLVVKAVKEEVKEEDETLGTIFGFLGNAAAVATERADTRSWHLLPGAIRVARLSLPTGVHDIAVELEPYRNAKPVRIDLGEVRIRPGSVRILSLRSWP
ncbi:MAG: hypothetical protein M8843_09410 [marine benthic group bacterium]|nr:hypothetical protein [Gemmatimonadota bacterium]